MFYVVIPARRASERLPDKALALIAGEAMIVHVWRNAMRSGATETLVATDDDDIAALARAAGACVAMTSAEHASGTDRIAEVASERHWKSTDIVVNVQGDEPLLPPQLIVQVAELLNNSASAAMATLCVPIESHDEFHDTNAVKVVTDAEGRALYFSRAAIPHPRTAQAGHPIIARRHVGIYAYRVEALERIVACAPVEIEQLERLEQLRALHLGLPIVVADALVDPGQGVDTQHDLDSVRKLMESDSISPYNDAKS